MTLLPGPRPEARDAAVQGNRRLDPRRAEARRPSNTGSPRSRASASEFEDEVLAALERGVQTEQRVLLARALPAAQEMLRQLNECDAVIASAYAGSLRRMKETIGDIDLLVAANVRTRSWTRSARCAASSARRRTVPTKSSIVTASGLQVDLRVVEPVAFGAALQYFTGSQAHNVKIRARAVRMELKLSEYGLFNASTTTSASSRRPRRRSTRRSACSRSRRRCARTAARSRRRSPASFPTSSRSRRSAETSRATRLLGRPAHRPRDGVRGQANAATSTTRSPTTARADLHEATSAPREIDAAAGGGARDRRRARRQDERPARRRAEHRRRTGSSTTTTTCSRASTGASRRSTRASKRQARPDQAVPQRDREPVRPRDRPPVRTPPRPARGRRLRRRGGREGCGEAQRRARDQRAPVPARPARRARAAGRASTA